MTCYFKFTLFVLSLTLESLTSTYTQTIMTFWIAACMSGQVEFFPISKALTFSALGKTFAPNVRHCSDIIHHSPNYKQAKSKRTLIWIKLLKQYASNARWGVINSSANKAVKNLKKDIK